MDVLGWAFLALIVVTIVAALAIVPLAAVGLWDVVRRQGTRRRREP